jgi:hypothetical protein
VVNGGPGLEADRPADECGSAGRVPLLEGDHADQVQGIVVVGLGGKDLLVQPGRLVEAAAPVLLQAEAQVVQHGHTRHKVLL